MRTIRGFWRLFRMLAMMYAIFQALRSSRLFFITLALLRAFQRRSLVGRPLVTDVAFVDGSTPVRYKRMGWRTIVPRRVQSQSD